VLFALAQINPTAGALQRNAAGISRFFKEAQSRGAGLVIFPETALTGRPLQDLLLYSDFIAETERLIRRELAPLTAGSPAAMLLGTPFLREGRLYNGALLLEDGTISGSYTKSALEERAPFAEERYFTPGDGNKREQWGGYRTAVVIGEAGEGEPPWPGGRAPAGERRLLINLVASPYSTGRREQREARCATLAAEQDCALLMANLVGGGDELVFDGSSLAFNSRGELLRRAASFTEEIVYLDEGELFAAAAEKHPDYSGDIAALCEALLLGIRDYFAKNGFQKALLGLSGGLDSAVTAALAAEALGPENVLGVLLPSEYSPQHSLEDARALAENLGMEQRTIPIMPIFHSYLRSLNRSGEAEMDLAEENLQARIRGDILMLIANRERRLLLSTGNRSELAVGYCTLYGDMAGALAVLADLPKLTVYELAELINRRQGRPIIPERTITKPPSAELRPDQLDEDSLPPYSVLDPILDLYIDELLPPAEIIRRGFDEATVHRIVGLVDGAEYKRRQAAPALRVRSGLRRRSTPPAYRRI